MKSRVLWLIVGNGSYSLFQALGMMVIAKFLGTESLGYFALALSVTAPVLLFSNFGLRVLWLTDTKSEYNILQFRKIRRASSLLGLLVCVCGALLFSDTNIFIIALALVSISKYIENQIDLHYSTLHKLKKQKEIAISIFIRGLVGFLGIVIGIYFYNSLVVGLTLYTIAWLVIYLIFDLKIATNLNSVIIHNEPFKPTKSILLNGLPLAITMLLINGNLAIPRLFLSELVSIEALGVYSALAIFILVGSMVMTSIGQVTLPLLAEFYANKEYKKHLLFVFKIIALVFVCSIVAGVLFYFFGYDILGLLFNSEIASYSTSLALMFFLAPLQYIANYMNNVISSTGNNYSLVKSQVVMVLSNIVFSYYLIPIYELNGAIYSVFLANSVLLSFYSFYYVKSVRLNNYV